MGQIEWRAVEEVDKYSDSQAEVRSEVRTLEVEIQETLEETRSRSVRFRALWTEMEE